MVATMKRLFKTTILIAMALLTTLVTVQKPVTAKASQTAGSAFGDFDELIPAQTEARAAKKDGWIGSGNRRQYLNKGVPLTGWQTIDGLRYYFNPKNSNYMALGWQTISTKGVKKHFYFGKKVSSKTYGSLYVGWQRINKKFYYFNTSGAHGVRGSLVHDGWEKIGKDTYYLESKGKVGDTLGSARLGWSKIDKEWFYFEKTGGLGKRGTLSTGWKTINKNNYYFTKGGVLGVRGRLYRNGLMKVGRHTYYFESTGKAGGKLGRVFTGWRKQNGNLYNFRADGSPGVKGRMWTGTYKKDGATFNFTNKGVLTSTRMNVPVEYQWNYRGVSFGNTTISANGCAVVSTNMALRYLTKKNIPMTTMRDIANPYFDSKNARENGKVYNGFFNVAAKRYGQKSKITTDGSEALEALKKGNPVLVFQRNRPFTGQGHWMVLWAATQDNKVRMNDPNDSKSKRHNYTNFDFYSQIDRGAVRYVIFSR